MDQDGHSKRATATGVASAGGPGLESSGAPRPGPGSVLISLPHGLPGLPGPRSPPRAVAGACPASSGARHTGPPRSVGRTPPWPGLGLGCWTRSPLARQARREDLRGSVSPVPSLAASGLLVWLPLGPHRRAQKSPRTLTVSAFPKALLWAELCPQESNVEVLTPNTSDVTEFGDRATKEETKAKGH